MAVDSRTARAEERWALAAFGGIILITIGWWALALWPLPDAAPEWLVRTREVCFGNPRDGLPPPIGWMLLLSQPLGMFLVLFTVWGDAVRRGFRRSMQAAAGRLQTGAAALVVLVGLGAVAWRVTTAEPAVAVNDARRGRIVALGDAAPTLRLVDQRGQTVALEQFRNRPVLVTFAFAHCEAICPTLVRDAREARRRFADARAVLVVVTLDPWRDTPSRLPSIAAQWQLGADEYVLSGGVAAVEASLNAWKVPRVRNQVTGELMHPSVTYVVGLHGELSYLTDGSAPGLEKALTLLQPRGE